MLTTKALALCSLIVAAIVALGCGGGPAAGQACPAVQLLAPDGTAIDLTGTWSGNDSGLYYIKQVDSCVWWSGVSNFVEQGQYPGQEWIMTFKGQVTSDGVLTGDFVDVKSTNPGTGTFTIEVRAEQVDGRQVINLYKTSQTGSGTGVSFWERYVEPASPEPIPVESTPPANGSPAPGDTAPPVVESPAAS